MDTSEKVVVFKAFEDLTKQILLDQEDRDIRAQRYPVRFIMLNNFNEFKKLAIFMSSIGVDSLDLEDLLDAGYDDEWITKDVLKEAVRARTVSTFVTPFSELVRFYSDDDFRGFFNEIMLLEDIHNPSKRIYLPLIGLQNRFVDFLNHFARIQESAPVWRYDAEPQTVEVYFTQYKDFVLPNETVQCQLNSLREWLKFWKVQAPQEKIVCTSRSIAAKHKYSRPDNIFSFKKIENAHTFMTEFLELRFPFEYIPAENDYWEELLLKIDKSRLQVFSFESFVKSNFNKVKFSASDILTEWADSSNSSFDRWLLKNYVCHTDFAMAYPYMTLCMDTITSLTDDYQLANMIATRIMYRSDENSIDLFSEERRRIMRDNAGFFAHIITEDDRIWLTDQIKYVFQDKKQLNSAIDLCTGVFDFERKFLMGWHIFNPGNKKLCDAINTLFPEYSAYVESRKPAVFKTDNQWSIDYCKSYKEAKILDRYTEDIEQTIKEKNLSSSTFYDWFFQFDNTHDVLAEVSNGTPYARPDKVYWIDGLGMEFLSLVLWLIEQEGSMKVIRSQITRSELPSSTHHNRFEGDNVIKYGALDELGHDSHGYKPYDTLIKEILVIKDIVKEILNSCKKEKCTVAIVSDHGLSCLSRKVASKKYDGKFEHEGRYIKTTKDANSDSDYIVYRNVDEDQYYKVALTHASLAKVPTHQVHGGCTPEEVLVPFILMSNKDIQVQDTYKASLIEGDIMLSCPRVEVSVIPQPRGVMLTCEEKCYKMRKEGTIWTAHLDGIQEGQHIIDIKPDGAESVEMKINVIGVSGGSDINDMFDL